MRNAKKLLALMLAALMVFGMVPVASAQTVHTHGIEEYTEMELGETYVIEIAESGETVYRPGGSTYRTRSWAPAHTFRRCPGRSSGGGP